MATASIEDRLEQIDRDGYTIVEDAIAPDRIEALREDLARLESELGTRAARNRFEGEKTLRVYNLLAHGSLWEGVAVDATVLPIVEGVLDRGCLVSSLSSASILPGETAQPIHADDALHPLPRPHPPTVCNSMWALTDFTDANGATRLVPGSHHLKTPKYREVEAFESIPAEMRAGSVLIWHGSLWHGGGANRTNARRVGIAMNYCAGFLRQQENQQLGIPLEVVKGFSPRLQQLAGFGTYKHLIGHIDKQSPVQALLDGDDGFRSVWDLIE